MWMVREQVPSLVRRADRPLTAVGYQAVNADGKTEQPNAVLEGLIAVVRPTGGLGIPGLYVPKDPGAPDSNSAKYVVCQLRYRETY